uniref:Large ribosomal subunit protein uL23c n=1 Tax=Avrainvillea sp. HV04061 TaxID=2364086 RepID=A0A3B8DDG6_9CHLO|nr:ribosomal protein L23 [Avrainvillea sp. HV04061]
MISSTVLNLFITDKSTKLMDNEKYTFDVDIKLTKPQIKQLIETLYNVKVLAVNTHCIPRKKKNLRTFQNYLSLKKRAIISLSKNQKIDLI